METAIRLERLTKYYGKHLGVADLNLEVKSGEVFGYLGPNGAGKTTTIRMLLDLIRPTQGKATVLGLDAQADSLAVRRSVGYIPAEPSLYGNLSGHEFLTYLASVRGGVHWPKVTALADRLECDLSRPIGTLSRGNKQKLAVIRAFMHEPQVLILDEPTSGLDPLMQAEFAGRVPEEEFARLDGVRNLQVQGSTLRCDVAGSLDPLIKAAARHTVINLKTHEPNLEDIFLAYYGEGTEDHVE